MQQKFDAETETKVVKDCEKKRGKIHALFTVEIYGRISYL